MGAGVSVQHNHIHELYINSCKIVQIDTEILETVQQESINSQRIGNELVLLAQDLDPISDPIEETADFEKIVENEKQILMSSLGEQSLQQAKAQLYRVAALLETRACAMFNIALPCIQQMLNRNIAAMKALQEVYANQHATAESMANAYEKLQVLVTDTSAYEQAEKKGKEYHLYGNLCRNKSKLIFMCANNPSQFESITTDLKDINSLFAR